MAVSRLLPSVLLVPLLAMPSDAQRIAPLALRGSDGAPPAASPVPGASGAAPRDTQPQPARETSVVGTVIGGIAGGALGTLVGAMVGTSGQSGCQGDLCGLEGAVLGAMIGEPLGLAIGAHLGSRSTRHEHVLSTSLASAGILVGGLAAAYGVSQAGSGGAGVVMLPLIPALQIITTVAIEMR